MSGSAAPASPVLHGYWRSAAAYRVRLALALKGVGYRAVDHDLRRGEQRSADYLALSPQGLVPALEADGEVLVQSPAILEWLEERWPDPPLLPSTLQGRAVVRAMAALVACDIHPLNNLRVLNALRDGFGADEGQVTAWIARWISDGFTALEALIARHGAGFAYGDHPTLADCCLAPQVYSARRFKVEMAPFPRILAASEALLALPGLDAALPERQADADPPPA